MSSSAPSPATVLDVFDTLSTPGTPLTTTEVADEFECTDRTIYNKLDALVDSGVLKTKKVGARGRVWWRPLSSHEQQTNYDHNSNQGTENWSHSDGSQLAHQLGGEMAERIREFEWAETPLGSMENWPQQLRIAVDIMLGATEAIGVYWGSDLTLLYNDAARELIGNKHPNALGQPAQEVFPEAWETLGPIHKHVMSGNGATALHEQLVPLKRAGELEDIWFDSSYNPIPIADGSIGGVFNIAVDVTDRIQTEQALSESEELLRLALDIGEIGVWEFDLRTYEFPYHSPRHDEIFGYEEPLEKWSLECAFDHFYPADREQAEECFEEALQTGECEFETRIVRADGEQRWIMVQGSFYYDDGEPVRAIGTVQDITERKQAEAEREAVREQLELELSEILGRVSDAFYAVDNEWRFTHINDRTEELLEQSREEMIGERLWDVFPEATETVAWDDFHEAMETNEPQSHILYYDSLEMWIEETAYPSETGLSVYFRDVTERKEAKEALQEAKEQLEVATTAGSVGVWTWNIASDIVTADSVFAKKFGIAPETAATGAPLDDFLVSVHEDDRARVRQAIEGTAEETDEFEAEYRVRDANGDERWVMARGEVEYNANTEPVRMNGALIDITERKRAQLALERLNDASRELIDTDTETNSNHVSELTRDVLGVEFVALWRYDETVGELREDACHTAFETDLDVSFPADFSNHVWQTFIGDNLDVENHLDIPESTSSTLPLQSRVLVPLGSHGVICGGSTRTGTFDEQMIELVETVAATVKTAWDRAEGEQQLKRQNQELARLDQLNTLIRQIDQALVQADTVAEIDQSVCERLADSDLFAFAWIGEFDAIRETIEPRQWAGIDSSIVEDRTITIGGSTTNQNPVAATVATRDPQVVADIATDRRIGSCRESILEEGARSCISIPLLYEETLYGVLTAYIAQPQPNERNQHVLEELGRTVAHAIHAAQKQETAQTDSVVELTLQFQAPGTVLARLARDADMKLQFKGIVPAKNGSSHIFFTGDRASDSKIQNAGADLSGISALTCVAEYDEACMYKATVSTSALVSQLATQNEAVRTLIFDRNTAVAVVDLPSAADVRCYIDDLQRTYSSVQLTSRRSCDRSPETVQDVQMAIKEPLTDRQTGVLKLAYLSGFFESPRENTGQEIADMLDVSPPTFTQHLRAAQQKVFALAFDEE